MRIASAQVRPVRLRFARPLRTAQGEFSDRDLVLLELRDADAVPGFGEAAPWPGFGTSNIAETVEALERVARRLAGAVVEADDDCAVATGTGPVAPVVRAALEGALLDLEARRGQRPLREVLAAATATGPSLDRVAVSALLLEDGPDALRAEAAHRRAEGYRAAKLKLGAASLATDLARVRAVREVLGPDISLRGDANGAWTATQALTALEALAEAGLDYVEQPVAADDFAGLADVRARTPVRIAADESMATDEGARRVIDEALAQVVVLKPGVLGGPRRALGFARQARRAGMDVVFTHAFESAVGARHALHCAAAWGDARQAHGLVTAGIFAQDLADPVACEAGYARPGPEPGIGILP
jgi:o-succinylbenzoate synthase